MRSYLYNTGYFFREAKAILRTNALSNFFSFLSIGLIFFILAMVISGWWASNQIIEAIQGEAEVNAYYKESLDNNSVMKLAENISNIDGVKGVSLINADEARQRMEEILGKEADVLSYLNHNPFSPFVEIKIEVEKIDSVLERLRLTPDVEYIRDNRETLERLQDISAVLKLVGLLIIVAVGISSLIIIAHIIRLGIYNNREQIETLVLLGAPEGFIAFPYILVGLLLNLGGGIGGAVLTAFAIKYVYIQLAGPLPFIPLPPQEMLISGIFAIVTGLSGALGIIGSLFGLSSVKS